MTALLRDIGAALLLGLALALALPNAYAGMIGIEDVERDRVKTLLERPELAAELQKMGVAPDAARARVEAMTPAELAQLAGRLDSIQAGGAVSNRDLLLIVLLVLLLVLIL